MRLYGGDGQSLVDFDSIMITAAAISAGAMTIAPAPECLP